MGFAEWIASRPAKVVYAAELKVAHKDSGEEIPLYLADHGGQWDGLHNFRPCLVAPSRLRRSAQGATGRSQLAAYGHLEFAAVEGQSLDSDGTLTADDILALYTFEGRPVTIRVGGPGLPYSQWWVLFRGSMGQPEFDNARARIPLVSPAAELLDRLVPPNQYQAGSGVPESVVGRAVPLVLGRCRNITPVLIDEASHRYQFHDPAFGPVEAVEAVRVDGALQTSGYAIDLAQGTITLQAEPAGQLTLDVQGRVPSALLGELIEDLLVTFAGVDPGLIDQESFSAFNQARPWPAGIYLDRQRSIKEVIDALLTGCLAIFSDTPDGKLALRALEPPSGDPSLHISESDIRQGSFRSRPDRLSPAWRVVVEGQRNWTPMSSPADSVGEEDRQWLRERFASRAAEDVSVRDLYPKAKELGPFQTYLVEASHLDALASMWLDLFSRERRRVEIVSRLKTLPAASPGDLVEIRRPRHGMSAGVLFRVLGTEEDHRRREIKLELWG